MDDSPLNENIYLTGARGFVGSDLTLNFIAKGFQVTPIGRSQVTGKYLLNASEVLPADTIIHAGIPSHPRTKKKRTEYFSNTKELFALAKESKANLIFISTHSCRCNNPSQYSRDKFELECLALESNGSVLRIGIYHSSQDSKNSSILRVVGLFKTPTISHLFDNIPKTRFDSIFHSLRAIQLEPNRILSCYETEIPRANENSSSSPDFCNSHHIYLEQFAYRKKSFSFCLVKIANFLTNSFADPFINLAYDLKHYAK